MIILGIDPGSRVTGYGLLDNQPNRMTYLDSGHLSIKGESLSERLGYIFTQLGELIEQKNNAQPFPASLYHFSFLSSMTATRVTRTVQRTRSSTRPRSDPSHIPRAPAAWALD